MRKNPLHIKVLAFGYHGRQEQRIVDHLHLSHRPHMELMVKKSTKQFDSFPPQLSLTPQVKEMEEYWFLISCFSILHCDAFVDCLCFRGPRDETWIGQGKEDGPVHVSSGFEADDKRRGLFVFDSQGCAMEGFYMHEHTHTRTRVRAHACCFFGFILAQGHTPEFSYLVFVFLVGRVFLSV